LYHVAFDYIYFVIIKTTLSSEILFYLVSTDHHLLIYN